MSDNWELFKENVLPVKRGRRVNELNENIDKKHNVNALEKVQEKLFEENIRSQTAPLDALRAYINYIKWTRDTFPSTSEKTLKLLEVRIVLSTTTASPNIVVDYLKFYLVY